MANRNEPHQTRLPGDPLPTYEELLQRIEKLEASPILLKDLPMTQLQTKLENDWQPNAGVLLTPASIGETLIADKGVTTRKAYLDTQNIRGNNVGYSVNHGGGGDHQVYRNFAQTEPMRITYTPPVSAWWEISAELGLVTKSDAAYHNTYLMLTLSPADADGQTRAYSVEVQHSGVQVHASYHVNDAFKLAAGVAYTCDLRWGAGSGGTYQLYQSPNMMRMHGKAWAR